jgi:hypothetical protein
MLSPGIWGRVGLVKHTDVSQEEIPSIFRADNSANEE